VLFVVDLSGYVFRAYHAITPLSNSRGEPTHAVMGTVNMLQKVVSEKRPDMFAVAMDSRTPSFRKTIDPRYKAHRPPAPEDLGQQMARCREIAVAYNIPVYEEPGFEADDLIAAVTARAVSEDLRVVIVSADKDLMQLVRDHDDQVVLWDSMRDRVYGPKEVYEKFGVRPSQLRDYLALTGDTSDNVPGVPGVGPKTAADLLNRFGDLNGVLARVDELKKSKVQENLRAHQDDARLSYELVGLRTDTPLAFDVAHLRYGGANKDELLRLFTELELHRLVQEHRAVFGETKGHEAAAKNSPSAAPKGPAPAPPKAVRTSIITTRGDLDVLLSLARTAGSLGVFVHGTSVEAMRADIIGLSLGAGTEDSAYVPMGHRYLGAPAQLSVAEVAASLGPVLLDASLSRCMYDAKFAEIVLARHGMPVAEEKTFDAMLAAYVLDPESAHAFGDVVGRELGAPPKTAEPRRGKGEVPADEREVEPVAKELAAHGASLCTVAARLSSRVEGEGLLPLLSDIELPLSHVLAQMEQAGVLVDVAQLQEASKRIEGELKSLEARAKEHAGREFSLRSRDQLEAILFDELKLPVKKRTPKGGRSTDAEVLEELAGLHPLPEVLLEYRELDKLKGTYLDALPRAVHPVTGRIHTRFDQAVAATGRLSSNNPNLQNIPIRTEVGKQIRAAFVAPKGACLVSADYSQIELRVLAHLSKDEGLLDAFRGDGDIHARTAAAVFDVPLSEVTGEMRRRAKTINFGVIYGMGESALAKQLKIPREEAARFIEMYFARYDGVRRFMDDTVAQAKKGEAVRTLFGRRRFLPNLHSANRGLRFEAERVAMNTPIQGTAADILKVAMLRLAHEPPAPGARMILTVHDELLFEVPEAEVAAALPRIAESMQNAVKLDVPLVVNVGHGPNWAAAH
jgi:DNA polymerase I